MTAVRSRTIGPMDLRTVDSRELIISTILLLALSRLVEPPVLWGVALLVLITTAVTALQLLAQADPAGQTSGVPIESLMVPAVTSVAVMGVLRLVPVGILLVPALALAGLLIQRTLTTEAGILASVQGPREAVRVQVMGGILLVAFLGFLGVAATVPGGLPDPTGESFASSGIRLRNLALLSGLDALIAGLLGYRAAALRGTNLREVLWSAVTCALVIGLAAAGLRAMAIPRLLGPALLVIVFYLWDTVHGAVRADERDARRIWEALLLAAAAVVVIVWSLSVPI